jgi:hypothetical protein
MAGSVIRLGILPPCVPALLTPEELRWGFISGPCLEHPPVSSVETALGTLDGSCWHRLNLFFLLSDNFYRGLLPASYYTFFWLYYRLFCLIIKATFVTSQSWQRFRFSFHYLEPKTGSAIRTKSHILGSLLFHHRDDGQVVQNKTTSYLWQEHRIFFPSAQVDVEETSVALLFNVRLLLLPSVFVLAP